MTRALLPDNLGLYRVLFAGARCFADGAVVSQLVSGGFDVTWPVRQRTDSPLEMPSPLFYDEVHWRPILAGRIGAIHASARVHELKNDVPKPINVSRYVNTAKRLRFFEPTRKRETGNLSPLPFTRAVLRIPQNALNGYS